MSSEIEASYESCRRIASASGSNFFRAFSLLRPDKRRSMMALYAYARIIDDLGDTPRSLVNSQSEFQSLQLHEWVDSLALPSIPRSDYQPHGLERIRPSLMDTIQRFNIPLERFHEVIRGVSMDQAHPVRLKDRDALDAYCYLVASSVGLACIAIWRSKTEISRQSAIECGIAFQLTNILRDVAEDAANDRVYIPLQTMEKYGVELSSWLAGNPRGDWLAMLRAEIERAKRLYASGWNVYHGLDTDGQRMFSLMWHTYYRLLIRIDNQLESVWKQRIRLGKFEKIQMFFQHAFTPTYLRMNRPNS